MTRTLIGAVTGALILAGAVALPAHAGGNCAEKAAALEKQASGSAAPQMRIANVLSLVEKAKAAGAAGKQRRCDKLLSRAQKVLNDS